MMIWLVLFIMALSLFLFIGTPLYGVSAKNSAETENYEAYETEIAQIDKRLTENDGDANALGAEKVALQRQMIKSAQIEKATTRPSKAWVFTVAGAVIFGTAGAYMWLGSPDLIGPDVPKETQPAQAQAPQKYDEENIRRIVMQLGQRLSQDGGDVEGWTLYARSLMGLKEYDAALAAYDKAVAVSQNDLDITDERSRAAEFISAQATLQSPSGPSQEDITAAQSMNADERQAMIESMVQGLADKLVEDPDNADNWVRLLRSRGVLGQMELARADIARMQKIFKDRPDVAADILARSGWASRE
ncbi:MAG: c-type cytochrome biogenesis protein CcmI [Maricaulaceae bacterium]